MGLIVQHTHVSDCSTGRKSNLIQEMSFCLVWGTRSMQPVHFVLIMAPRSSKASSQLMAGSCGEISENILICQCQRSDLLGAVRGMEVYSHCKSSALIHYAHVIGVACFNVCTGDIGPFRPLLCSRAHPLAHILCRRCTCAGVHSFLPNPHHRWQDLCDSGTRQYN
jgi:hypothetical protein